MSENYDTKLIGVTSGRNFRELGGYETITGQKIKYNKLLRTGNLADLNQHDLNLLHDYGVKYDVDFRTEKEKNDHPDIIPEGAQYEFVPVFGDDLTNASKGIFTLETSAEKDPEFGFKHMFEAYEDMINGQTAQKAYRRFFELLLANTQDQDVLLFHCTAGKDRTGFAAFLVLSALGVPLATIKHDYVLTNITTQDFVENMLKQAKAKGSSARVLQAINDIQSVYPEYLDHAIHVINKEYGSSNNYLKDVMHLSINDIMDLRRIYLTNE
ncbi:protein-tyrosine phosphatase [Lactobacillus colini]|uniref:Protein-tyrosine phosphatase n=1 Tax=Lactobacillus colini TaxID=1819254 RepID=A0ABS4MCP1_9LACO|nr:tyrosine-protein phosphatase [Lactobacillus colini]MBP2057450.1 protein-tyrosine phosphatase [Lactobacillus colini]